MPKNINDFIWILFISGAAVLFPLIRSWIIGIIDKRLESVTKEIEGIKHSNIEFEKKFLIAVADIKADIRETRHSINTELQKIFLRLEQDFVQKKDCDAFNKEKKHEN